MTSWARAPTAERSVARTLDQFRLDGRVAIVTGTSSGLGRRFAQVFDAAGAAVVLASRRNDRNVRLASELQQCPGGAV